MSWRRGSGKERIGIIPCTNNMVERLVEIPGGEGRYILSENIVLHYIGKVFKGYKVIGKSLIRVVRNADIDADALYDEDLDYREFMADLNETEEEAYAGPSGYVQRDRCVGG